MVSKILTFSVLSVFCVLTAISSVYAHNAPTTYVTHCHDHGENPHCHSNAYGTSHYGPDPNHAGEGIAPTVFHEHWNPSYDHDGDHASGSITDWVVEEETDTEHTHQETVHQHDDYVVHIHSTTHSHSGGLEDHSHPLSHWEFGFPNHDGVGRRTTTDDTSDTSPTRTPPAGDGGGTPAGPPGPSTTTSTTVGDGTTAVVESGTSEGTSSPQPAGPVAAGSAPQERRPASSLLRPIRVTEYMVRDWSKGGAIIGNSNLPQWIELHNPNATPVNLKGWTFQYATRFFANHPYTIHTLTLATPEGASEDASEDGFSIPAGGVAILSTQQLREEKFSGIEATQVYNLNIENVLKRGWVLTDANGKEVQRIGRDAFSALRDPVAPRHQDGARVSYQVYLSESPSESYYYGDSRDIGSPGFYAQPAPAAPSAVIRKRVGTWAALKK